MRRSVLTKVENSVTLYRNWIQPAYSYSAVVVLVVLFNYELGRAFTVIGWSALMLVLLLVGHRANDRDFKFQSYILAILVFARSMATNLMLNRTAGRARRMRLRTGSLERWHEEGGDLPPDPQAEEAPAAATRREQAERLRGAILTLRDEYRAILSLRYFRGLAYDELAASLDLPIGTVKNRLFRAREALAKKLEDPGDKP